ncbi:MAG TPA: hypothetical protein VKN36_08575 [Eudoraea sp.]|nr:hypothetical protein [Eudoraea sp.]
MKSHSWVGLTFLLFLCCPTPAAHGQDAQTLSKKEMKVKKKTVMEQYEPALVLSVDDRIRLKKERIALLQRRRRIIDTLKITDRKKRRLLKELYSSPTSDKWERVIADIQFQHPEEY